ncbi:MAG: zinc ribbon domain-containing protein [Acidobacteria bacterium]|nr:zinc ribbon domain-containing protein [Acidobacteriota bacterium]
MPIYVFRCQDCCQEFNELRSVANRNSQFICPKCGGEAGKAITSADFRMKGGTRNHRRIKMWPIEDRLRSQYGDNR